MSDHRTQFWVLDKLALGVDHDKWWVVVLSKRATLVEQAWWDAFKGKTTPPSEVAPFKVAEGRHMGDVMGTGEMIKVYSSRLSNVLTELGCTGFNPRPVVIYDRKDEQVVCSDAVWNQNPVGCGPVDESMGFPVITKSRDPLLRNAVGLFFDHSTWTGLDLFRPPKFCDFSIVTDRIARGIQSAGLQGYVLRTVEEYGIDLRDAMIAHQKARWGDGWPETKQQRH